MPLSNPFRRQSDSPSLRERAADLRTSVANAIRKPKPEAEPEQPAPTLEEFGQIDFDAYVFDFPVKAPQEWADRFSEYGLAMHIADRAVRMAKPELMAFIVAILDEGDGDPDREDGGDAEPSLGAPEGHDSQVIWLRGGDDDREVG